LNIFDAVETQARERPHAVALLLPERTIGYAELAERVRRVAAALRRRNVREGDVVGVLVDSSALHVELLLALARIGAAAISIGSSMKPEVLSEVVARFGVGALIGNDRTQAVAGAAFLEAQAWLNEPADAAESGAPNAPGGDRICTIGLTSGTTGLPKATAWSHAQTIEHLRLQQSVRPFGPGVRFLVFMGLNAPVAAGMTLRQLLSGAAVVLTSTPTYDALCDAVDRLGVTHVLSSPFLIQRLLDKFPADTVRFPLLAGLRLAGAAIPSSLHDEFVRRVSPNVFVDYGSSEVGALAVGDRETIARHPEAVGRLVPWVEAETVDDAERPLPTGEPGVLRFRGTAFPTAYYADPEASARGFRDGWFYPGDFGRIVGDRMLVIESRVDDLLNVGGVKVMPSRIEEVLMRHPDVVEAAAYAVATPSGEPVVVAATVVRGNWNEAELLRHCSESLPPGFPSRLLRIDRLPRNEMGKVLRQVLVEHTRVSR
jgi:acyl-coenzyme A synthetase/AMP-(fatty) acid ligase